MHSAVTEESIQKANDLFWEQMLGMELRAIVRWTEECDSEQEQIRCIGPAHVLASCDLSGVWGGRIEVRLSQGLARTATSAMLMQPVESVGESDTLDAAREIANMIAGTLKSALPRPCALSVPSAAVSTEDFCVLPRTHDSVTVFFQHDSGMSMVRVWEYALVPVAQETVCSEQIEVFCAA